MALENKYSLTVNLKAKRYGGIVPNVTANDNVVFEIAVIDDTIAFPLLDTYRYTLVTLKKNKTSVIREGTLVNGLLRFEVGGSETTIAGKVDATVQIYDTGNKRVSSAPLAYNIVNDPSLQGGLPTDDKTLVIANESLLTQSISKSDKASTDSAAALTKSTEAETNAALAKTVADLVRAEFDRVIAEAGSNNPEVVQARKNEVNLNARLNKVDSSLAEMVSKKAWWNPPTIPSANLSLTYPNFIANTFETLRSKYPNLISRSTIGTDPSGNYPIYEYCFAPASFEQTVFITAGIHGDEPEGYWGIYNILKEIYDGNTTDKRLRYIRDKVRIVLIPVVNTGGYVNFTRVNPNGINLNRNFDVFWNQAGSDSQGGTPFSQSEALAVKNTIDKYNGEFSFHLDFHTVPYGYTEYGIYGGYCYVKPNSLLNEIMHTEQEYLINSWNKTYSKSLKTRYVDSLHSDASNYLETVRGVPSTTLEFATGNFSTTLANSAEMTRAVEWYGNVLISLAEMFSDGAIKLDKKQKTVTALTNIFNLDLNNGVRLFTIKTDDAVAKTLQFSNVPKVPESHLDVLVFLDYLNAATITFPSSVVWQNGIAPTFTVKNKYVLQFRSFDNGKHWIGSFVGAWAWNMDAITDDFNRANSTTSLGTATTGQSWMAQKGTWGINSNKAYTAAGSNDSIAVIDSGESNVAISVDVTWNSSGGIVFRVNGTDLLAAYVNSTGIHLYKFTSSTNDLLGEYLFTPVAATTYAIKVIANGSSIKVSLDGTERISAVNTFNQTFTKHGLRTFNDLVTKFDNFKIEGA
ncbi:M14 family zinc carboxypeptidase [Neobacillus sp. 19]|uniref:M14 family zinc carboxypeptidase n=1 Tax=Neobacillus sp. 19 TaxID=3394458 RepID=UPI003BF63B7C